MRLVGFEEVVFLCLFSSSSFPPLSVFIGKSFHFFSPCLITNAELKKRRRGGHLKLDVPVLWRLFSGFKLVFNGSEVVGWRRFLRVLGWTSRLGDTHDLRFLPRPSRQTPDQRLQSLLETLSAVITHRSVRLISLTNLPEYGGVSDLGRWTTGGGAFLAGVGQVIVAGYVAPAAVVVPNHHHTVLSRQEVAVGLPSVPVLIQQWVSIRPAEIILNGFVIEPSPLVFFIITVQVRLLLRAHDGHQVSSQHAAVLLGHLPAQTLAEVSVAETLELVPAQFTSLQIGLTELASVCWQTQAFHVSSLISACAAIETWILQTGV